VLLAALVAALHGAAIGFMLTGSLLALRWPRVLWLHVPVSLAILTVYLTGSDCPLTTWELALRERAGEPGYRGGFIGHYITEPFGFPIEATSTQVGIYVAAVLPNVVGYALLAVRYLRPRVVGGRVRPTARPAPTVPASRRSRRPPRATPASARGRRPGAPARRG
jgi:hypothetical protein